MIQEESQTVEAKHVFLDIVGYTHKRSVEAQSDLIRTLNSIVKKTIEEKELNSDQYIFIPTGDGMCISIINVNHPYDIHIQIALSLLEKLYEHNKVEPDKMRQFQLRIGINDNIDNLIIDINENKNISGAGINIAARIESLSDSNQIIVGNSVYEKLVQRERYMELFVSYSVNVKHGLPLKVHQFVDSDLGFINNETPNRFKPETEQDLKFSKFQGYYLANCIEYESFLAENTGSGQSLYSLMILLSQLTDDLIEKATVTRSKPSPMTIKVKRKIKEHFDYIQSVDFWIICDLSKLVNQKLTNEMNKYFSDEYLFVNEEGRKKLIKDCPGICKEFGIS